MTRKVPENPTKLSVQQRWVLLGIYQFLREDGVPESRITKYGVPVRAALEVDWEVSFTPSQKASLSRSLRRLSERGLIERLVREGDGVSYDPREGRRKRTHYVMLTPLGLRVVRRLVAG